MAATAAAAGADLKTSKNKPCKVVNGFTMLYHYTAPNMKTEYYRCTKYHKGCPARAKRAVGFDEIKMSTNHNHVADPVSPVKRARVQELKEKATANFTSSSMNIAKDAQNGLSEVEVQRFPTLRSLQQIVANARRPSVGPEVDKKPPHFQLPNILTITERSERFLLYDSRVELPAAPVILVFASDFGLQMLRDYRTWSVDSTFFAAPMHWDSLMTINVMIGESSMPAVYIALPNRLRKTYDTALKGIFDNEELQGVEPGAYLCGYVSYFRNTYMGNEDTPGRYKIKDWNVYQRTLEGRPRTNNGTEGWHFRLNQLVNKNHPLLSKYETNPGQSVRGRPSNASAREQNLRALVSAYDKIPQTERPAKRINFLKKVQYHLSERAFARVMKSSEQIIRRQSSQGASRTSQRSGQSSSQTSARSPPARSPPASPSESEDDAITTDDENVEPEVLLPTQAQSQREATLQDLRTPADELPSTSSVHVSQRRITGIVKKKKIVKKRSTTKAGFSFF